MNEPSSDSQLSAADNRNAPRSTTASSGPSRTGVWSMFDRIAHRYDLLNRILSFGQDVRWRKRLAHHLPDGEAESILDIATGTADVLLMLNGAARIGNAVGIDMSEKMLARGNDKIRAAGLDARFTLKPGDATAIPEPDASFDVATIAFGIRNVMDADRALQEMRRVLKPGGRALILEFALPRNVVMRRLYLFYFRHILPLVGGLISGDSYAYRYLNQTVESFPYGEAFLELMTRAGFENPSVEYLTFGVAAIYQGDRAR